MNGINPHARVVLSPPPTHLVVVTPSFVSLAALFPSPLTTVPLSLSVSVDNPKASDTTTFPRSLLLPNRITSPLP